MELEQYIKKAKEVINAGYFDIQDALMKYDEALKKLKDKGWKSDETAYQQEYQKTVETFNQEISDAVMTCKSKVQEQKESYMEEVQRFYAADGGKLDLNFMNLIKAELPLTVEEITAEIVKNADNPTMLRVIHKYLQENNSHLPEGKRIVLEEKYQRALYLVDFRGKKEEQIFDKFNHLAAMGMEHPDKNYTLYQQRLDEYEEGAILEILKAKLIIDDQTQERINEIEKQQTKRENEKNKGKTWGYNAISPIVRAY